MHFMGEQCASSGTYEQAADPRIIDGGIAEPARPRRRVQVFRSVAEEKELADKTADRLGGNAVGQVIKSLG